ncbi:Uncharacterised protein [uncultured archaeon]|nr:Uncharacterised protein [uncultured archaeon]
MSGLAQSGGIFGAKLLRENKDKQKKKTPADPQTPTTFWSRMKHRLEQHRRKKELEKQKEDVKDKPVATMKEDGTF